MYYRLQNEAEQPKLSTIVSLCVGFSLDTLTGYHLIALAGYTLLPRNTLHRIYAYFIENSQSLTISECNKFLEDMGFYIVDNMPAAMILKFAEFCAGGNGRYDRVALVYDVRTASSFTELFDVLDKLKDMEAQCRMLADSLDIPVICGDSISVDTLRTADVGSCNAFVAVTGSDEDNLVACQIAKREFGVDRTVARASNPKNRELLHTLGVDTVVCGTDNLSHILEREIETDTIRQLLSLGGGTASLNEILLPENFKFAGQAVKDIPMPGDVILVCITRDAEFIIPHGNTTLLPWDRILCLTQDDTLHLLMDAWGLSGK